jgi:hypothetical protein
VIGFTWHRPASHGPIASRSQVDRKRIAPIAAGLDRPHVPDPRRPGIWRSARTTLHPWPRGRGRQPVLSFAAPGMSTEVLLALIGGVVVIAAAIAGVVLAQTLSTRAADKVHGVWPIRTSSWP